MYFEERIIDGFLCYRTTSDGNFTPYTSQQLTAKLMEARRNKAPTPAAAPLVWPTIGLPAQPAQPAPVSPPGPHPWNPSPWQYSRDPFTGLPDWTKPFLSEADAGFSSAKS